MAGKSQGSTAHMNIVAIIIESYVLESIWLLAVVILWNEDSGIFLTILLLVSRYVYHNVDTNARSYDK